MGLADAVKTAFEWMQALAIVGAFAFAFLVLLFAVLDPRRAQVRRGVWR